VRFGDVLLGTGETECQFSRLARDLHYDGVEAIPLHARVELFVSFAGAVFLETVTHNGGSVRGSCKAMLNGGYFCGWRERGSPVRRFELVRPGAHGVRRPTTGLRRALPQNGQVNCVLLRGSLV
jgi:hypothetical protein